MTSAIQNSSPVETVQGFLSCVEKKDANHMRKLIHPNGTAVLIRKNEPKFMTLHESIDNLERAEEKFVETIWDEIEQRDGDYATVWTKFRITRDGQASTQVPTDGATLSLIQPRSFIKLAQALSLAGRAHPWVGLF